jgi:hypothetical protein
VLPTSAQTSLRPNLPSAVLALLLRAGFLERIDSKDVPTQAALGLFEERDVEVNNARFAAKRAARQRAGRSRFS